MNPQTNSVNPFNQPTISPAQAAQGRAMQAARPVAQPLQAPQNYAQPVANPFTASQSTAPFTPISPRVPPTRVGVFVDYEAGEVSFYNVTDRSHLYTFTETFTEKIWPLFYPGIRAGRRNAAPLSICEPTDWE